MYEQLDLYSLIDPMPDAVTAAVSCFDRITEAILTAPNELCRRLVPDGEYVVDVGGHPLVLRPTKLKESEIPQGHHFYHYRVGERIYAGIFVGIDMGGEEDVEA